MKKQPILSRSLRLLVVLLLAMLALSVLPASAQDRDDVDIDIFYSELAPYGRWFEHPVWGRVWRPNVDPDWRPYWRGSWVYTEDGWFWEAEEPWGWAAFHYGRWLLDDDGYWIWIPDTEWGPAWVAWRSSEDYVGWAPLPPDARWGADGELFFDTSFYAPRYASVWCFVHPHQLVLPSIYRYLAPRRQNHIIFRHTHHLRSHHRIDGRVVNTGFDARRLERLTGRPVVRMQIRGVDSPQAHGFHGGRSRAREISVYRPHFRPSPEGGPRPALISPDGPKATGRTFGADGNRERPARQFGSDVPDPSGEQRLRHPQGRERFAPGGPPAGERGSPPAARLVPNQPAQEGARQAQPPSDFRYDRRRRPAFGEEAPDRGRGPPPGMRPRAYGGPSQGGVPRGYTAPGAGARPDGPPMVRNAPPRMSAPPPSLPPPAVRGPAPEPRRGPPRKDDGKAPG